MGRPPKKDVVVTENTEEVKEAKAVTPNDLE